MVQAYNTVLVKGRGIRKERIANAAITPGMLVELMSTDKVRKHATSGGLAAPAYAVENELFGKGISTDIASADQCVYEIMPRGAEIYALLPAAAAAIVIGDKLCSAGDGTLVKTSGSNVVVAIALQAVDNSGGGSVARILVEVV